MLPNNSQQQVPNSQQDNSNIVTTPSLRISDILIIIYSHWYWILICLLLSWGVASFILKVSRPIYTRTASILLKDMSKGTVLGASAYGYSDQSLMLANTDLTNEMFMIKSPAILNEVIKRLDLQMSYEMDGQFHKSVLYGSNLPFTVKISDIPDQEYREVSIQVLTDSTFQMSDYKVNGHKEKAAPLIGKFGKTLVTPIGKLQVTRTSYFYVPERPIIVSHLRLQNALTKYTSELTVRTLEGSTIISMIINDHDIQRAEEILYNLISIYNEQWMADRNQVSISTNQFIGERLKVIEGELGSVDSNISDYKSEHLILGNVESQAGMYVSQSQQMSDRIVDYNNQLYMTRSFRSYLTNENNFGQLLPSSQALGNSMVTSQIASYNALLLRRNSLVAASSLENPIVKDIDNKLASLRNTLINSIDTHINDINLLMSSAQNVQARSNSKVAASPSQNKYLLSVERQQKVKESLYLFLLQKREENELSQAFTAYNSRTVNPPSGLMTPTKPVKMKIYVVCLLAGLLIPIGFLLLAELANTSVRGRKDLECLNIPFLGEIPNNNPNSEFVTLVKRMKNTFFRRTNRKEDKTLHLFVKKGSTNVMNEAFRVVRTNLEFIAGRTGDGAHVIMLTSFNPNSGKTFIASNLGIALSFKDKRVLIIDMDMRKRSISALVGKRSAGLSNYLGGYIDDYHQVIKHVAEYDNLDVFPAGKIPPNPTELLYDEKLDNLMADLRKEYDYIFMDCPPLEIVADASIAARLADMTIFVARAEALQLSALPDVQKYYDQNRLPKMNILLNAPTDAFSRYGYHRYGARYGYSYGYGRDYSYGYGYTYGKNQEFDDDK